MSARPRGIAMVLSNFHAPLGGTQKQALRLGRELAARGLAVTVVSKRHPTFKPERGGYLKDFPLDELRGLGLASLPTSAARPVWSFLGALLLWAWRHRRGLDVLHAHNVPVGIVCCLVGSLLGKRVVVKVPAWEFVEYLRGRALGRRLRRWVIRARADRVVAVNAEIAEALAGLGIPRERIALIPNGIELPPADPAVDAPALRRALLGDPGLGVVLFVGRLVAEKSLDRLLGAWAALPERDRHRLVLVGDGPLRADLETLAERLGLGTSVLFVGHQRDVAPFYALADVFVLPSRTEGLSNALLEAMVAGLPVVVSDITGNRQLVDEDCGVLVGWEDTAGWVDALARLLGDGALRRKLGEAARQRVRAFAIGEVATRYLGLYEALTAGRAR